MTVTHTRRVFVTFSTEQANAIKANAKDGKMSASKYIVKRLELLDKVEADPVGQALVKTLNGSD